MVNYFIIRKMSAKVRLHNEPMKHYITLAISRMMPRQTNSSVLAALAVRNQTAALTLSGLIGNPTRKRAEQLRALARIRNVFPALFASIVGRIPPSTYQIAFPGTIFLVRPTVKRIKGFAAPITFKNCAIFTHVHSIDGYCETVKQIEEKYCEIAAKRLAQEVFAL